MFSIIEYLAEYDAYTVYVYNNGTNAASQLMKTRLGFSAQLVKELGYVQSIQLTWEDESGIVDHFLVGKADQSPEGHDVVVVVHDADGAEQLLDYEYQQWMNAHSMEEWVSAEIVRTTPFAAALQRSRETTSQIGYVEIRSHMYSTSYELWNGGLRHWQHQLKCPVCYVMTNNVSRFKCGHYSCSKCTIEMARRSIPCPLCRAPLYQTSKPATLG